MKRKVETVPQIAGSLSPALVKLLTVFLSLAMLLSLAVVSSAAEVPLPEDAHACYLTVFGQPQDREFQMLTAAMDEVPELAEIRERTHYHVVRTTDRCYGEYRSEIERRGIPLPCVRVQKPDGRIVYEAAGAAMPANPSELAQQLSLVTEPECGERFSQRNSDCRNGRCRLRRDREEAKPDEVKPDEEKPAKPKEDVSERPAVTHKPIQRRQSIPWGPIGVAAPICLVVGMGIATAGVWKK